MTRVDLPDKIDALFFRVGTLVIRTCQSRSHGATCAFPTGSVSHVGIISSPIGFVVEFLMTLASEHVVLGWLAESTTRIHAVDLKRIW